LRLSANLPIPGLAQLPESPGVDLRIWLGSIPSRLDGAMGPSRVWYSAQELEGGEPRVRVWTLAEGRYFRFLYADETEFVVDRAGTCLWARWPAALSLEDTAVYLLGPILGFVLLLRGTTCLHASSVAVRGGALALLGPAGAGKSTTAAALSRRGYPVLSEDVVTLSDQGGALLVQPGYPCIRLWPASVRSLYGSSEALPRLTPNWEKRGLGLTGRAHPFQAEPLPLEAIYLLGERTTQPGAPYVEAISARDGLLALVANTYANYLEDRDMRAREFDLLARVVAELPLRRVVPHADVTRLGALCETLVRDYEALIGGESREGRPPAPGRSPVPATRRVRHV
jgi:hypothetical protein